MARFGAGEPNGVAVQQLEMLVRTAIFKPANALVGYLLQGAAERIDATYQAKPGEVRKTKESLQVQGIFGAFQLQRDYYYDAGRLDGVSLLQVADFGAGVPNLASFDRSPAYWGNRGLVEPDVSA